MKTLTFLYKILKKISGVSHKAVDYPYTRFLFSCLCESFHDFKTNGIPCIYVSVREKSSIRIGRNFRMNNGMSGNQIGFGETPCVLQALNGGKIVIGDNVGISQTAIIALADVTIGNNVMLGAGVKLYTSDFHSLDYKLRRNGNEDSANKKNAPIVVEHDCFIGAGTIILKGVTIGAKSIVGAGSVVTKNVPSGEVWAGNPARFIKKL